MLSPNELEVMDLLWTTNCPLSSSEIVAQSPDRSWKASTIHLLLNSLLKKEMIAVVGFKPTGKNYVRTFLAAKSREEYAAGELAQCLPRSASSNQASTVGVIAALVDQSGLDEAAWTKLQRLLDERKTRKE